MTPLNATAFYHRAGTFAQRRASGVQQPAEAHAVRAPFLHLLLRTLELVRGRQQLDHEIRSQWCELLLLFGRERVEPAAQNPRRAPGAILAPVAQSTSGKRTMEPSSFDARPAGARAGWRSLLVVGMLAALPQLAAASWQRAYVEPTVDGLEALLRFCETRRAEVLERHRAIDEWAAYQTAYGVEVDTRLLRPPVPECDARALVERLGARHVAVWAMASSAEDGLLFATVNLDRKSVV